MIHSATWECDESRPHLEERQRPLVVSLSQRVPCSHDPRRARAPPDPGARSRRRGLPLLRLRAQSRRAARVRSGRARAGARSGARRGDRSPLHQTDPRSAGPPRRLSRPRCGAPDPRLELHLRLRRHRRRPRDRRRPAGQGLAQRRVAGLRGAARRQRDAPSDRGPNRARLGVDRLSGPPRAAGRRAADRRLGLARHAVARARGQALALAGRVPDARRPRQRRRRSAAPAGRRDGRAAHPAAGCPRGARGRAGVRARHQAAPNPDRPRSLRRPSARARGRTGSGPDPAASVHGDRERHGLAHGRGHSRHGHRASSLAGPDRRAGQPAGRRGAGRRYHPAGAARQYDRRTRRAGRNVFLVLPVRHPGGGHGPAERRPAPPARRGRRRLDPRGRGAPDRTGGPGSLRGRRLPQRAVRARSRHRTHSPQPAGAVPRRRGRAIASRRGLRRHGRRRLDALRGDRFPRPPDALVADRDRSGRAGLRPGAARLGLPRAMGSDRPAARYPPAAADRRGRSAPRPADRRRCRPSAWWRHRPDRSARGRGESGRSARGPADARGAPAPRC